MRIDFDTIGKLHAKATPGEWMRRDPPAGLSMSAVAFVQAPRINKNEPYDIEVLGEDDTLYPTRDGDVNFIVAVKNAWPSLHAEHAALLAEYDRLREILDTPIVEPFAEAVACEAKHQRARWGDEKDRDKTPWDWFWLLGHLASKAAHCALAGDTAKALHHMVTAAASLANWHRILIFERDKVGK